jgi:hypothetical protein
MAAPTAEQPIHDPIATNRLAVMIYPRATTPSLNDKITVAVAESLTKNGFVANSRRQDEIAENFFRRHPGQFIKWLTKYYPLTHADIAKHQDQWDWSALSGNRNIQLTDELVDAFEDRWAWTSLISHPAFFWSESLFRKHEHRIFENALLGDDYSDEDRDLGFRVYQMAPNGIRWSESLIERHLDRWDWGTISSLGNFPWSSVFLEKHESRWNWEQLSGNEGLPWSLELLDRYADRWHWEALSHNTSLPWSESLIEKYADRWNWDDLSANEGLPWSGDLIAKYRGRWNWHWLVANSELPWSAELVTRFADYWAWNGIPELRIAMWSEDPEVCCCGGLSENQSSIWSDAVLKVSPDEWDWLTLSGHEMLPWSAELLSAYEDRWNWDFLSSNVALPWSESLLRQFEDRWDWNILGRNQSIPWSEYLTETFIHRLKTIPSGMTVSIDFAGRHQQFEQYEGIKGVFNRTPEAAGYLTCFYLSPIQVRRLMAECLVPFE